MKNTHSKIVLLMIKNWLQLYTNIQSYLLLVSMYSLLDGHLLVRSFVLRNVDWNISESSTKTVAYSYDEESITSRDGEEMRFSEFCQSTNSNGIDCGVGRVGPVTHLL